MLGSSLRRTMGVGGGMGGSEAPGPRRRSAVCPVGVSFPRCPRLRRAAAALRWRRGVEEAESTVRIWMSSLWFVLVWAASEESRCFSVGSYSSKKESV